MNPAQVEVARQLHAQSWWEWRTGIRPWWSRGSALPDLADTGGTGGVLLEMLHELGVLSIGVHFSRAATHQRRWYVTVDASGAHYGSTLAEAAARALLFSRG